jgi:ABC-type protease/lipase transport system fused ATPase/permease subunit
VTLFVAYRLLDFFILDPNNLTEFGNLPSHALPLIRVYKYTLVNMFLYGFVVVIIWLITAIYVLIEYSSVVFKNDVIPSLLGLIFYIIFFFVDSGAGWLMW